MVQRDQTQAAAAIGAALGTRVVDLRPLRGGNNQLYLAACADGRSCVAKVHAARPDRPTPPLEAEHRAFRFLQRHGVGDVPRLLALIDDPPGLILEHIDGAAISSGEITGDDVDRAADFLVRLAVLRDAEGATQLPDASEACVAVHDILWAIKRRLTTLRGVIASSTSPIYRDLSRFLDDKFEPTRAMTESWARSVEGPPLERQLPREEQTLSPSDFGFHNALRRADSQLVFLDFEYFGWDDPAKMIADFILHPGMNLSDRLGRRFVETMLAALPFPDSLSKRLHRVYPLQALNWCLILLNEFIPAVLLRRRRASAKTSPDNELRLRQLEQAHARLDLIRDRRPGLPYSD